MEGLNNLNTLFHNKNEQQNVVINNDYRVEIHKAGKTGNSHHAEKTFYIYYKGNNVFSFSTMSNPAGCATLIIYNTSNCSYAITDDVKAIVLRIFELYNNLSWGGSGGEVSQLLTVFGDSYYKHTCYQNFIELGFKVISEYTNYAHGKDSTQRLLQLLL